MKSYPVTMPAVSAAPISAALCISREFASHVFLNYVNPRITNTSHIQAHALNTPL